MRISLFLFLLLIFSKNTLVDTISCQNQVNFEKNLFTSDTIIAGIVHAAGLYSEGNNIETTSLLINTLPSSDSNSLMIGNNNQNNITFSNLPDISECPNPTKNLALDSTSQVCIFDSGVPPDTLSIDTLLVDNIYGNINDTLIISAPNGTINIGNKNADTYLLTDTTVINGSINSQDPIIRIYSKINTETLTANNLRTDLITIGKNNKSKCSIFAKTLEINSLQTNNFIIGNNFNPIESITINRYYSGPDKQSQITLNGNLSFNNIAIIDPLPLTSNPQNILIIDENNALYKLQTTISNYPAINFDGMTCKDLTITNSINDCINLKIITNNEKITPTTIKIMSNDKVTILNKIQACRLIAEKNRLDGKKQLLSFLSSFSVDSFENTAGDNLSLTINDLTINTLYSPITSGISLQSPFNKNTFPQSTIFYSAYLDETDYLIKKTPITGDTYKSKKNYNEIKMPLPRIFLYKENYCQDICPKSQKRKYRLGCFPPDTSEEILNPLELSEDLYSLFSDLENKITNKELLNSINTKIQAIEMANEKLELFLNTIRKIKTMTGEK
jgi:hypothetical protein